MLGISFKELIGKNTVPVVELPDNCYMCPFHSASCYSLKCNITEHVQEDCTGMKRMRGCPLRVKKEV